MDCYSTGLLVDILQWYADADGVFRTSIERHAREAAWLLEHDGDDRSASRLYRAVRENARVYGVTLAGAR